MFKLTSVSRILNLFGSCLSGSHFMTYDLARENHGVVVECSVMYCFSVWNVLRLFTLDKMCSFHSETSLLRPTQSLEFSLSTYLSSVKEKL